MAIVDDMVNKGAVKYDQDKARMELIPLEAVEEVAKVMTFGAIKYADDGWKEVPRAESRYTGALLRHLTAIQKGEVLDKESGLPHIAHVSCNALFLTHLHLHPQVPAPYTPEDIPGLTSREPKPLER